MPSVAVAVALAPADIVAQPGHSGFRGRAAAKAVPLFERAVSIYESLGDRHFCAGARLQLAYVAIRRGDTEAAVSAIGSALPVIRERLARATLGDGAYDSALEDGRQESVEVMIERAAALSIASTAASAPW